MGEKFRGWFDIWEFDENGLKSGTTPKFERGDTVGVVGDEDNPLHGTIRGISCDVKADTHIDALLFEVGGEISVREGCSNCGDWSLSRLEATEFQDSTPDGKKVLPSKFMQPGIAPGKRVWGTRNRKLDGAGVWSAVVVEYAKYLLVLALTAKSESFDERRVVRDGRFLGGNPQEAAIYQDDCLCIFQSLSRRK